MKTLKLLEEYMNLRWRGFLEQDNSTPERLINKKRPHMQSIKEN